MFQTQKDPVELIRTKRDAIPLARAVLVAVSGIDGSGKGYVTERLAVQLREQHLRVAVLTVDDWLHLPAQRFSAAVPALHFYEHAIRYGDLFAQLLLPLTNQRSIRLETAVADATNAESYRLHTYEFEDVEVILVEGIFLLKREHRKHFDLSFWVDCTFETALERALARSQEGLSPEETVRDYETIYFPAERIHLERDDPRAFATAILNNDPRLSAPAG